MHTDAAATMAREWLMAREATEGIEAREMARRLGMHPTTWSRVRTGNRPLGSVQIIRACREFRELRDLLFSEEDKAS